MERLLALIDGATRDECILATWPPSAGEYPSVADGQGGSRRASHVVLERTFGPRPVIGWMDDLPAFALHSCDTPMCVNPWHLSWGTPAGNTLDMMMRARNSTPVGERHHAAILDADAVRDIRQQYIPGTRWKPGNKHELAALYGITPQYVVDVARGVGWQHLD